jgi:hypothetical protein
MDRKTLFLFLAAVVFKTIDIITTFIIVSSFGTKVELNPILRTAMNSFLGVEITLLLSWLGVILITLYGIIIRPSYNKWLAPALTCGIYLPIAIGNSISLFL